MRELTAGLENCLQEAVILLEDNQSTISMMKNPKFHGRSKHVSIKYHFIRDQVSKGIVELKYCPTKEMVADMMTKGLPKEQFTKSCDLWLELLLFKDSILTTSEEECWNETLIPELR